MTLWGSAGERQGKVGGQGRGRQTGLTGLGKGFRPGLGLGLGLEAMAKAKAGGQG